MTVDLEQTLTFLVQIIIIVGGVGGGYFAIKKWVKAVAKNAKETARQLETSNGHTVGELVEDSAHKLDELTEYGRENRTLIEHVSGRLDAHIAGHP